MSFLFVLFSACFLDLLSGDPRWLPHPVRIIGRVAELTESFTRKLPFHTTVNGCFAVIIVVCSTGGTCLAFFSLLAYAPQPLLTIGAVFVLYTTIAGRDLIAHTRDVAQALFLDSQNLQEARTRVGMIVGRDTKQLDTAGIVRACIESVAENMSDGIIAPLFWSIIAASLSWFFHGNPITWGATAAMLYKAVNTMDSMFGYKNERYLHFGACAARLDDLVNFFPARISGFFLIFAALLCRHDTKNSFHILTRDRQQHNSPNAGWPEAAMAGALRIQLGGTSSYFGKQSEKPTLGDPHTPPTTQHIAQANTLVIIASLLCLLSLSTIYTLSALFFFS
ncbi:adenosylcobinamide-phosphate synthase CbiB [Candidatus Electrothrix sp.]|uniref:adenosylcobinamide-phosphate synthase CbiB n=1 Tax=Candidatus Electrothrix sp. TaxID=2170559 RepID=UPI004056F702